MKPIGWRYDSVRHALAARGVRTKGYFARWGRVSDPLFKEYADELSERQPMRAEIDKRLSDATREFRAGRPRPSRDEVSEFMREFWEKNPDLREKMSEVMKVVVLRKDPGLVKDIVSESSKRWWGSRTDEQMESIGLQRSDLLKSLWQDPEYREKILSSLRDPSVRQKMSEWSSEWQNVPENVEKRREIARNTWANLSDEERARRVALLGSTITPKQRSEMMLERWKDPEYREKVLSSRAPVDPGRMSEISKNAWMDEERRMAASNRLKNAWLDEKYRENAARERSERFKNPDYLENVRSKMKAKWEDPQFKENMEFQGVVRGITEAQGAGGGVASLHRVASEIPETAGDVGEKGLKKLRDVGAFNTDSFMANKARYPIYVKKRKNLFTRRQQSDSYG